MLPVPTDVESIMNIEQNISDSYYDPFINKLAKNKQYLGGGWRLQNVFQQALDEAFIGLGCNIELEKLPPPLNLTKLYIIILIIDEFDYWMIIYRTRPIRSFNIIPNTFIL